MYEENIFFLDININKQNSNLDIYKLRYDLK